MSGTVAVMVSPQLYNGILLALGNNAVDLAITDPSGAVIFSGNTVIVTDFTNMVEVSTSTFEY